MRVVVNGREKNLRAGATLKSAIADEPYVKGSMVSVHLSEDRVVTATRDFEIVTDAGRMVLHLNETPLAEMWRGSLTDDMEGMNTRWVTHDIAAFGSFPTDLEVDRGTYRYDPYDVFLALGGFDNHTTYVMVSRDRHNGCYGAGHGLIGKITVGRHILDAIREGDRITSVRPLMSETSTENVVVTDDLKFKLEEGYRVDTYVGIKLDHDSPEASEHVLVMTSDGTMSVTEDTGSYMSCSEDLDVKIPVESCKVRENGAVAVRNSGLGTGRIHIYRDRRQLSPVHSSAGTVTSGRAITARVVAGQRFTVVTDPARILSVGMTQKAGEEYLRALGVEQVRTGDVSDDAIIAEQGPEHTMTALAQGRVETFGVPRDRVFRVKLDDKEEDKRTLNYFKKVTGLNYKPIGTLKVQFTFEGLPMVTFYGDEMRGKTLYPLDPVKRFKRGDIGITNQVRPHHGLIGIRLADDKTFGPTGEEAKGTNLVGRFVDDIDRMMDGLEEEDTIYITEVEL
ncbi:MAG: methanogenesis marker 3 protein [Candidatus Methanomethylophilaceae archaeon]|nr:methanogenesis marker 3 protein [Candidatus Methanomethylophilaceae archaeon]